MKVSTSVVLVVVALGFVQGCRGKVSVSKAGPTAQSCTLDSDCPSGMQCVQDMCVGQGCDVSCQVGERSCQGDVVVACYLDSEDCPHLFAQWRCESDRVCVDGMCVSEGCVPACQLDERSCRGGNVVTACERDDSGCPVVVEKETCGADEHCDKGRCVSNDVCSNECSLGETACSENGLPSECQVAETGCLTFVASTPCQEHQVCDGGQCRCQDSCQAGQSRCGDGGGVQQCLGPDANGCTYWGEEQPCGPHQSCNAGVCECIPSCEPGSSQCGPGGGEQTCETDADGCAYLSDEQECYADMECVASEGRCMPHTDSSCYAVNECLYYGQKKCMDTDYYGTCRYGDDGCLHWDCST